MNHTEAAAYVARFAAHWNPLDPEKLGELMHEDTRNLIPPMTEPADRAGVIAHFQAVKRQLPDLRLVPVRWSVDGDAIFIEWVGEATVAGKTLSWHGVDRVLVRDGKTYAAEAFWDTRRVAELVVNATT